MSMSLQQANRHVRKWDSRFGISRCEDRHRGCYMATIQRPGKPPHRAHCDRLSGATAYLAYIKANERHGLEVPA